MDDFKSWVRELRKHFPPLLPVRVYRKDLSSQNCAGLTYLIDDKGKPTRFVIFIHKSSYTLMFHMLIHEWAHAYAWHTGPYVQDHGIEWALAMSKIYRYFEGAYGNIDID